jgi:aspartate racemase
MKRAGIIGGIAPESTVDYYRSIVREYRQRNAPGYPSLLINSIDLQRLMDTVNAARFDEFASWLADEVQVVEKAGADFAVFASNTPHIVFEEVQRRSRLPLLSIVEVTCAEAKRLRLRRLALLGTRFTMLGRFYPDTFARDGISIVRPDPDDLDFVHEKYFGELVNAVFLPETRAAILQVIARMRERHATDGVILAGTELPLLLRDHYPADLQILDTTQIHVRAIVDTILS